MEKLGFAFSLAKGLLSTFNKNFELVKFLI